MNKSQGVSNLSWSHTAVWEMQLESSLIQKPVIFPPYDSASDSKRGTS